MIKKGVIFAIFLVICSMLVIGEPNADISISPGELYEGTSAWFNVSVNNFLKDDIINSLAVELPVFDITDYVDFIGWDESIGNNTITWSDGTIETNVFLALFMFEARAPIVDMDEDVTARIIAEGDDGTQEIEQEITILNDDTPPVINDMYPEDGDYFRQGADNVTVWINITDPETGIYNVIFNWWDCSPDVNKTVIEDDMMTCETTGYCYIEEDFSDFIEGDTLCFEFTAKNRAQETTSHNGEAGFDGTPPNVNLTAPENGAYANGNTEFSFIAEDNMADTLSCTVTLDLEVVAELSVENGVESATTINFDNMTEGTKEWSVRCEDMVGLSDSSEKRTTIIDRTPPEITLLSPENGSLIGAGTVIEVNVDDNYEVDTVLYSQSVNTSEWAEGPNDITVTATDKAGNTAEVTYSFILDRTAPEISVVSPENGSEMDVHGEFVFDIDDNYDDVVDCELYVDGELEAEANATTPGTETIELMMDTGSYEWHLTCVDDAGNAASTNVSTVDVKDLSGPDIEIKDIEYVARTEPYEFEVTITDISGVQDAYAEFDGEEIDLEQEGDVYTGTIVTDANFTLGIYTLTVYAQDTLGWNSSLEEEFELVQGLAIELNVPANVDAGQQVHVEGTVEYDDGAEYEGEGVLIVPGATVNVTVENGSFEYYFDAPDDAGDYDVSVEITTDEGFVHRATDEFTVSKAVKTTSRRSSSSSKYGHVYCPDGRCEGDETCSSCPQDCGVCPEPEEEKDDEPVQEEEQYDEPVQEEPQEEEESRAPAGIGHASGWFNIKDMVFSWWGIIVLMAILGITAYTGFSGDKPKNGKVDWDSYFKSRR